MLPTLGVRQNVIEIREMNEQTNEKDKKKKLHAMDAVNCTYIFYV